jgi:hypothetical protein
MVAGVEYVTQRRSADPTIRVINISLGTDTHYDCLCDGPGNETWLIEGGQAILAAY